MKRLEHEITYDNVTYDIIASLVAQGLLWQMLTEKYVHDSVSYYCFKL